MYDQVIQTLEYTMTGSAEQRNNATQQLQEWAASVTNDKGYIPLLLQIVDTQDCDESHRMAAAIQFKNIAKNSWDDAHAEHPVNHEERQLVRNEIVGLMLRTTQSGVRNTLMAAIGFIADVDFPNHWGDVVNQVVAELNSEDMDRTLGALSVAHGVFQRYRKDQELNMDVHDELLEINSAFIKPLLELFQKGLGALGDDPSNRDQTFTAKIMKILATALEVFFDIIYIDIGDDLLSTIDQYMDVLLKCIEQEDPNQMGDEYDTGPVILLKTAALDVISHFLQKYDEDMDPYVETFTHRIWDMLKNPDNEQPVADNLVIGSLNFLSCICQGAHRNLLGDDNILADLCQTVILPNMTLTEDEVDMFDSEPTDYIERDIEGSDFHTRRRAASELVQFLMVPYEAKVGAILFDQCQELLQRSSRGDWKAKDTAIYIVTALAIKGGANTTRGVTNVQINTSVPLKDFYDNQIVPELRHQCPGEGSHWLVKADAMRFLTIFRHHLDASQFGDILSCLAGFISEKCVVVHTYAAHAIERMLMMNDNNGNPLLSVGALENAAPTILANLCGRLQNDSRPNAYNIQCLMRIVSTAPNQVQPYVGDVVTALTPTLEETAKNPENPLFNHNLFETVSQTINCDTSQAPAIESVMWPTLMKMLEHQEDVPEFVPYVMQILAQLLDCHPNGAPIPDHYKDIIPPLVMPVMYSNKGNIPAVIRLLAACVKRDAATLHNDGLTDKIIGVFQHLTSLKQHDHDGLNLLTVMMLHYPHDIIDSYIVTIFHTLLTRLKNGKTPKFQRLLNLFVAFLIIHRGASYVIEVLDSIQNGLSVQILDNVFLHHIQRISGNIQRKAVLVAVAALAENEQVQQNEKMFGSAVYHGLHMIHGEISKEEEKSFAPKTISVEELKLAKQADEGFTNTYCPLKGAAAAPEDPCSDINDPAGYFKNAVGNVLNGNNHLADVIHRDLDPEIVAAL